MNILLLKLFFVNDLRLYLSILTILFSEETVSALDINKLKIRFKIEHGDSTQTEV